jgi:mRNA-degrading endonuclease toxin of MazEF toxin-antitoxin module
MAIPLTSRKLPPSSFHVELIFQGKLARILTEQMRVVDKSRIKGYCGKVNRQVLKEVERAIHIILDLEI